jgi:sporulation protein YlmC with PRC-barrel domain
MKASDLLGRPVLDARGSSIGYVTDLRCTLTGPLRGVMCTPRIEALVVSRHRLGSLLGYDRRNQQGPWLIRLGVRGLHRHLRVVPWSSVDKYDDKIILKP